MWKLELFETANEQEKYVLKFVLTNVCFMMLQRKLYMVGICLTIRKRAKITLDTTVETTLTHSPSELK